VGGSGRKQVISAAAGQSSSSDLQVFDEMSQWKEEANDER
jgi:hypothetical protein